MAFTGIGNDLETLLNNQHKQQQMQTTLQALAAAFNAPAGGAHAGGGGGGGGQPQYRNWQPAPAPGQPRQILYLAATTVGVQTRNTAWFRVREQLPTLEFQS